MHTVRIKKDEFGNIEEIKTDFWDMMAGNDVKVRGNSAIIEYHGVFGIGRSKHIIPMKKIIPTKREVKEVIKQDAKEDLKIRISGHEVKLNELSPELRKKLGFEDDVTEVKETKTERKVVEKPIERITVSKVREPERHEDSIMDEIGKAIGRDLGLFLRWLHKNTR